VARHFRNGGGNIIVSTAAVAPGNRFATLAAARSAAAAAVSFPSAVDAEGGRCGGVCDRARFPTEIDQLAASVAANHAETACRMGTPLHDHRVAEEARRERASARRARDDRDKGGGTDAPNCKRSEASFGPKRRG